MTLADMGLMTLLVRGTIEQNADENTFVGTLLLLRLLLISAAIIIGFSILPFFHYAAHIKIVIGIASIYALSGSINQMFVGILQRYRHLHLVAGIDIGSRTLQALAVFLLIRTTSASPASIALIVVISEIIRFGALLYGTRRFVQPHLTIDLSALRNVLRDAFPIAASLVFILIYFKLDAVLLSLYRTPAEVGFYSLAYKVLELAIYVPALYIGLVLPEFARTASRDALAFRNIFARCWRVLCLSAIPITFYVAIMAPRIVHFIAGAGYEVAGTSLRILALAIFLIFFGNLGGTTIIALNLQCHTLWIYGWGAVLNVTGNLLFMPRYGYLAASWMTVITELFVTTAMFVFIIKKIPPGWFTSKSIWAPASAGVITALLMYVFRDNLALGTLCAGLYFPLLLGMGGLQKSDIVVATRFTENITTPVE